jgi:8-oxo-dGTP pyrophosphatase MutT (NUDIX family)
MGVCSVMPARAIDALYRGLYRLAHPPWQLYLRLLGSRTRGAQVAVWHGGRVLLIRNSYRRRYVFPGGYLRSGEDTATAACRELREETGISVTDGQLDFAFAWTCTRGKHEAHDDIYECHLHDIPEPSIDNREVVEANFLTPGRALALPLEKHIRHYLSARS